MRTLLCVLCVFGSEVTPVQKVIQLLNGMVDQGVAEKRAEQVQYAAFDQWCKDTDREKTDAINEANEAIELFNAKIEKAVANVDRLTRDISTNEQDISVYKGDEVAATKVREIERADFVNMDRDYSESIDALRRAVNVLKQQNFDRAQAQEALLQVERLIPVESKKTVTAFISLAGEDDADHLGVSAPDAHAYEFQSGGIVKMLEGLHGKFEDERRALRKAEANSKHAYQMLMDDLAAQIKTTETQRSENQAARADNLERKAKNTASLNDTTATRDDDQKYLAETKNTCAQKAADFEQRQELREDELTAIKHAIEILGSDAVSGAADKHLPSLVQKNSFLQLRTSKDDDKQFRVARYLQDQGSKLNSHMLSALAIRVEDDPFKKVRQMIQDMIHRLLEEANQEATQKGWCDKNLKENEITRKQKSNKVDELTARRDELSASITQLGENISELQTQLSTLAQEVADATANREQESKNNAATLKDSKEAQQAVARALAVLKNFYDRAAKATSFVQQPAIFDSPYTGMQGENGGVLGMLEVIQSDFQRLEMETKTAEDTAQSEHEAYLHAADVDKTQKRKDLKHAETKKSNQEEALQQTKSSLEGYRIELDDAMNTYDKLKHQCIDAGVSYEERVARREAEIQSLKEALRILSGEV